MVKQNFKKFMPIKATTQQTVLDENNGTTIVTCFSPASNDSLIYSFSIYNSENVIHYLNIYYKLGSNQSEPFTQIKIPALAGADGDTSPRKEAIDELNIYNASNIVSHVLVPYNWKIQCNLTTNPSAGNKVVLLLSGQDYG